MLWGGIFPHGDRMIEPNLTWGYAKGPPQGISQWQRVTLSFPCWSIFIGPMLSFAPSAYSRRQESSLGIITRKYIVSKNTPYPFLGDSVYCSWNIWHFGFSSSHWKSTLLFKSMIMVMRLIIDCLESIILWELTLPLKAQLSFCIMN